MPLKTPKFWYREHDAPAPLLERVLGVVAPLYQLGHRVNQSMRKSPYKADMPLICVGGAVAGGSGKTPVCSSLMRHVLDHSLAENPAFLMRGYGGSEALAYIECSTQYDASQVGDEALLLAEVAPVVIARDRVAGVKLASAQGVDLLIMDDGLQNNTLVKDLTLLVVDGGAGFGNGKTLPAGPLREPVQEALRKVDAAILIGADLRHVQESYFNNINLLCAQSESVCEVGGKKVLAFAGIGIPEKFFNGLCAAGLNVVEAQSFSDHHFYSGCEVNALHAKARKFDAILVTTQKDMVRLKFAGLDAGILAAGQALRWDDESALLALLKEALA